MQVITDAWRVVQDMTMPEVKADGETAMPDGWQAGAEPEPVKSGEVVTLFEVVQTDYGSFIVMKRVSVKPGEWSRGEIEWRPTNILDGRPRQVRAAAVEAAEAMAIEFATAVDAEPRETYKGDPSYRVDVMAAGDSYP